jgi:Zn-dependent M28 family amino/carboxypeptidase
MVKTIFVAALISLTLAQSSEPARAASGIDRNARAIDARTLLAHIKKLASDEFEGRSPSSKGETLTVQYLSDQFRAAGCTPGNPNGTFVQTVPLLSYRTQPEGTLKVTRAERAIDMKFADDFVAWTRKPVDRIALDGDLVFVGYGVTAPEFNWNDLDGMDLKGKVLVMLVNDPPLADEKLFGGRAMTYYGRWPYKYEQAARAGAAGCIVIHETVAAGYPWEVVKNSWGGESFTFLGPDNNESLCPVEGWITSSQAEQLFALAGTTFADAKAAALKPDFAPMALGCRAKFDAGNAIRRVESRNVVAKIDGSDAKLKNEIVIFSAHWDHLGVGAPVDGDAIYNGAVDNATGVAGMLELAKAYAKMGRKPKRTLLFLLPTAEERGLLGSAYYGENPLYPLERTVANINMDGLNVLGRTRDITVVGFGKSTLDDVTVEAARAQGRIVKADPEPEKGSYYRSDHFNLAKVGVPALYVGSGIEFIGKPADFGTTKRKEYTSLRYHKPSDEVQPDWDLSGAIEDLQLVFQIGLQVANTPAIPTWRDGDEFKARRDAMMRKP